MKHALFVASFLLTACGSSHVAEGPSPTLAVGMPTQEVKEALGPNYEWVKAEGSFDEGDSFTSLGLVTRSQPVPGLTLSHRGKSIAKLPVGKLDVTVAGGHLKGFRLTFDAAALADARGFADSLEAMGWSEEIPGGPKGPAAREAFLRAPLRCPATSDVWEGFAVRGFAHASGLTLAIVASCTAEHNQRGGLSLYADVAIDPTIRSPTPEQFK